MKTIALTAPFIGGIAGLTGCGPNSTFYEYCEADDDGTDTDEDGLTDMYELATGTDPDDADSDDDGVPDGDEQSSISFSNTVCSD